MGGFGEVLPRFENHVALDPQVRDRWGIPVLRFNIEFGDNEKKMAEDMAATAREMFEAAGIEILDSRANIRTAGWSIHELGTARMGTDPKTSVLNEFQQSHDVKNLFVVDGSSHVNAGCQNPTWTIMALCLALVRLPGGRAAAEEPLMGQYRDEDRPGDDATGRGRRLARLGAGPPGPAAHGGRGLGPAGRGGAGGCPARGAQARDDRSGRSGHRRPLPQRARAGSWSTS